VRRGHGRRWGGADGLPEHGAGGGRGGGEAEGEAKEEGRRKPAARPVKSLSLPSARDPALGKDFFKLQALDKAAFVEC
jgi:hypothetical protein